MQHFPTGAYLQVLLRSVGMEAADVDLRSLLIRPGQQQKSGCCLPLDFNGLRSAPRRASNSTHTCASQSRARPGLSLSPPACQYHQRSALSSRRTIQLVLPPDHLGSSEHVIQRIPEKRRHWFNCKDCAT
eukprot:6910363-Pyramimonas_sp.AAC.1